MFLFLQRSFRVYLYWHSTLDSVEFINQLSGFFHSLDSKVDCAIDDPIRWIVDVMAVNFFFFFSFDNQTTRFTTPANNLSFRLRKASGEAFSLSFSVVRANKRMIHLIRTRRRSEISCYSRRRTQVTHAVTVELS